MAENTQFLVRVLVVLLAGFLSAGAPAQVPDLTKGDKPTLAKNKLLAGNLGPTGLLGWVYHQKTDTSRSRQILVTQVDAGSPADGVIRADDVILGASGNGQPPKPFTADARRSFADAINDAEARDPATLSLIRWRAGKTETVAITLETMGAYSATAPYGCDKSMRIIAKALQYIDQHEAERDRFWFNTLTLIATNDDRFPGNAERLARARRHIIELLPDEKQYESMTSDKVETYSKIAWTRSYRLIVLAEYYLATGDNPTNGTYDLLTTIDAYAQTIARGQSMYGTTGHQFAMQGDDGSIHGPYGVGYGPVNATGLACFLGLVLAQQCDLPSADTNTQIQQGIDRACTFFSSYVGLGSIPYGEHGPYLGGHAVNGKNGLAAVAFSGVEEEAPAAKYFAQMSVAAASGRVGGHGGAFFNYTWSPLGANTGGPAAGAAYFREARWHYDLSRTWEGGFFYNDYGSPGYHNKTFAKAKMYMSTPALLTYAMPLRKLFITGSHADASHRLSATQIEAAQQAMSYAPATRGMEQLIRDLSTFSTVIRQRAAAEFAQRPDALEHLDKLHQIAKKKGHPARVGVISILGRLGQSGSMPLLIELISDPDTLVAAEAIGAIKGMPTRVQTVHIDTLLKKMASLKRPPLVVHPTDPMNASLIEMIVLMFDNKGILGKSLAPVDQYSSREQLHEAIRAAATLPNGGLRSRMSRVLQQLSRKDVIALYDTLYELVTVEAPGNAMFAENIRSASMRVLFDHRIKEVVPASVALYREGGAWTRILVCRAWSKHAASIAAMPAAEELRPLLREAARSKRAKNKDDAQEALDALDAAMKKGPGNAKPFESITDLRKAHRDLSLQSRKAQPRGYGRGSCSVERLAAASRTEGLR